MGLAREADRRIRGESLSYVFFDFGFYPDAAVRLRWLEQWGSRNQFISGITLAGLSPNGALGATLLYMYPQNRKINLSVTAYYLLSGLGTQAGSNPDLSKVLVGEAMVQYAYGSSYGFFVSSNSTGSTSIGITMYNIILFPFLL